MSNKKNQIKLADLSQKAVLTTREVSCYTGLSMSALYKLMMRRAIPFSRPFGKVAFFDRVEVEKCLMSAKIRTTAEVGAEIEAIAEAQKIGRG